MIWCVLFCKNSIPRCWNGVLVLLGSYIHLWLYCVWQKNAGDWITVLVIRRRNNDDDGDNDITVMRHTPESSSCKASGIAYCLLLFVLLELNHIIEECLSSHFSCLIC